MLGVREFIKLVCSCVICHAGASVEIPCGTQKKYCCKGSLAQIRALTWVGPPGKVNGILVPRIHCLVLEALLATLRTREKCWRPEIMQTSGFSIATNLIGFFCERANYSLNTFSNTFTVQRA